MRTRDRGTCRLWLEPLEAVLAPNNFFALEGLDVLAAPPWPGSYEREGDLFSSPVARAGERWVLEGVWERPEGCQPHQGSAGEAPGSLAGSTTADLASPSSSFGALAMRGEVAAAPDLAALMLAASVGLGSHGGDGVNQGGSQRMPSDLITRVAGQPGQIRVDKHTVQIQQPPRGNFALLSARATHNGYVPPDDVHQHQLQHGVGGVQLPYDVNVRYETNPVGLPAPFLHRFSSYAKAYAKTLWVQGGAKPGVAWTADESYVAVLIESNMPNIGERAGASWVVRDPATFDSQPGESFIVEHTSGSDWLYHFPTVATVVYPYTGSVQIRGSAGSNLPGLSLLYSFQINLDHNGQVAALFASNPALGLNDVAITQSIIASYAFDAANGNYYFAGSGVQLGATVQNTGTYGEVQFTTDFSVLVSAWQQT